jgi:hypothetical protein
MPSAEKQWAYLCKRLQAKQRALSDCLPQLFQKGVLASDQVANYLRLNAEVEEVRKRMDDFVANPGDLGRRHVADQASNSAQS